MNVNAGEYCELEVRDTGCGITEKDLHKIFEPFYTSKKAGEGTGLELSTVYTVDGRETFLKLREIDPDCKVILSSGYTKDKSIDELLGNNLNGFISKPYSLSQLSHILRSVN
ncbi:MAG: hypothetical protein B6241_05115 [Spirochaetaceae bacterium 4572_59]|nr:MAG: hypothetical protein B6241_05115 [Spirochaetaceae bacterium 4572_59]